MTTASTLPELARELGFPVKKQGRSWGGPKCPSCGSGSDGSNRLNIFIGRDGKWRFRCHACYTHGDAADFLAKAKGVPLREAIREVAGSPGVDITPSAVDDEQERLSALKLALDKIAQRAVDGRREVGAYLASRGISRLTLDRAIGRGIVRCLPAEPYAAQRFLDEVVGQDLLHKAGLVKPGSRWAAIAFRPLMGVLPGGGAEFRLARDVTPHEVKAIRYGRLAWPWWWRVGESPVNRVIVVEGLIDLLSIAEAGLKDGEAVMGMPGAAGWKPEWFSALAQKHGNARLDVGLDADDAGNRASEAIIQAAQQAGLRAVRLVPPSKDWNEALTTGRLP